MKAVNRLRMGVAGIVTGSVLAVSAAHAVDNRVPSFWGGVSVKVMETYGNNNSKPLTGAKVVLDALDPGRAGAITARYPVIKFPIQRTSQTRGVTFTRLPPVNDIGEYVLTVTPPARGNRVCEPYNAPRGAEIGGDGSVTVSFRKSPGPSTTRRTFNFKCSSVNPRSSNNKVRNKRSGNNAMMMANNCHDVRVQGLGAGARYGRVTLKSCKQSDGKWKIEPYEYRR